MRTLHKHKIDKRKQYLISILLFETMEDIEEHGIYDVKNIFIMVLRRHLQASGFGKMSACVDFFRHGKLEGRTMNRLTDKRYISRTYLG